MAKEYKQLLILYISESKWDLYQNLTFFDGGSLLSDKNVVIWEILKKMKFSKNENFLNMPCSTEFIFFSVCGLETEGSLWQHRLCHGMCCISPVGQYQGFQAESGAWSQPQVRVCGRDGDTALGFLSMIEHNTKMQGSVQLA